MRICHAQTCITATHAHICADRKKQKITQTACGAVPCGPTSIANCTVPYLQRLVWDSCKKASSAWAVDLNAAMFDTYCSNKGFWTVCKQLFLVTARCLGSGKVILRAEYEIIEDADASTSNQPILQRQQLYRSALLVGSRQCEALKPLLTANWRS